MKKIKQQFQNQTSHDGADKVFIPFCESLQPLQELGETGALGELVPYQLEYRCVRLLDGTYDFTTTLQEPTLQIKGDLVHAA